MVSCVRCATPDTITRIPRISDSVAFSAACRHTLQVRNKLSPSVHSPVRVSRNLGVDAARNRVDSADYSSSISLSARCSGECRSLVHSGVFNAIWRSFAVEPVNSDV
jgi:hypothetical protein